MAREAVKMAGVGKKANARPAKKCQLRQQKCFPLEPVLEHCVAKVDEAPRKQPKQCSTERRSKAGKSLFCRLRDGYVKLMNDMASSADLSGVSAMYVCSSGQVDYPNSIMRSAKEDEEIEEVAQMARKKH